MRTSVERACSQMSLGGCIYALNIGFAEIGSSIIKSEGYAL